ncbi:BTB/POZ domain-containing protein KCTD16a [Electrophorus electricus]|uniref:BTB domain-containing protein n=1 Tax=Electrophorus electricus TaxID=8005 RepID=A0A4W4G5R2_ELEEL|nr:BTB/POZ domain-containing protein KCTD16a [Electrophorus electricus]
MALTENCSIYQSPKDSAQTSSDVIELNVGGQVYYTRHATLTGIPNSLLGKIFSSKKDSPKDLARDMRGRYFIDRDGFLFRYVLDYLRDKHVVLPDQFPEKGRLRREAEYFQLPELVKILTPDGSRQRLDESVHSDLDDASQGSDQRSYRSAYLDPRDRRYGFITVGYKGCSPSGKDVLIDFKGRGLSKIFTCGRIGLVKEVFGDALNESRDPDRPPERYTSRFYLKSRHLERAFDMLAESGFHIVACNSSLTSPLTQQGDDRFWCSNTEYVFYRGPSSWSSSHCECCCKSQKSERDGGESCTSFNELSSSCSETQSEASSPQETVIARPASKQPRVQTLDRHAKKAPGQPLQHTEITRRRTALLRARTSGPRDGKRKAPKEKLTPEQELQKCIQDFRRIKIPERFPDRKSTWQSELLRKYRL